ncbi:MAG: hypothetical protein RBT65_07150 [Methanolobus sp.]|nr:hypothetical protein [Methanolobus sp.]
MAIESKKEDLSYREIKEGSYTKFKPSRRNVIKTTAIRSGIPKYHFEEDTLMLFMKNTSPTAGRNMENKYKRRIQMYLDSSSDNFENNGYKMSDIAPNIHIAKKVSDINNK